MISINIIKNVDQSNKNFPIHETKPPFSTYIFDLHLTLNSTEQQQIL